jgi:hypothetical protein
MRTMEQETRGGTRSVRGVIAGTGSSSGPGWTATHRALGDYLLRFSPPFKAAPVVTGNPAAYGNSTISFQAAAPDSIAISAEVGSTNASIDWSVAFHAEGPA